LSGFAAIFRFDGAPADTAALAAMTRAIAYRGPDGSGQWAEGPTAIAHLMLHTTAESLEASQPLANEGASLVVAMDGWLANPEELRKELLARGVMLRTRADAELVLRAYETWVDDCPKHIDGEYAFVIWDARRREAFCAKDHAGMRPLYYHWDGRRLLVATDMAGVLAAGDFERRPNKGMIAEHLAREFHLAEETLWQGVVRLLPAHSMRAGASGLRCARHWTPPTDVTIRYPRDDDYQAHYREVLYDAVRRASRTHRPLGCEVSGGHDSSALFAVAHRLAEQDRLLAPELRGYTLNFGSDADPMIDEIEYARAVGAHLGRAIREVPPSMPPLDWFAQRARENGDLPPYPNLATGQTIGQAVTEDGCRVVLNGEGGDDFLTCHPFDYYEHLADRDWTALAASLSEDLKAFGLRKTAWMAFRFGAGPFAPKWLKALRRQLSDKRARSRIGHRLLTPELVKILDERRAEAAGRGTFAMPNPGKGVLLEKLAYGFTAYGHDFIARDAARLGYEYRSPMYARDFIEFALSIPERQRRRGELVKYVHLAALTDELPRSVLDRRDKALFNWCSVDTLDRARPLMINQMLRCKIDWLDGEGFEALLDCYDRQPIAFKPIYETWSAVGFMMLFGPTIDRPTGAAEGRTSNLKD
jgi:asparagine synthase (glutamine-hydrolysing)